MSRHSHKSNIVSELCDKEIIDLYFARSEDAIKQTDIKYGKYLFSVAERIVHSNLDSEECLNDTYLAAWNSMPPERPAILRAFLTRIMRNIATDRFRQKTRKKRIPPDIIDPLSDFENILIDEHEVQEEYILKEIGERIDQYVRSLSERRMYIFMARYYFSRPTDEIAEALGVSVSTVSKELTAIKIGLRQVLESEGYII